jgi:hypothetical protein
MTPAQPFRVNVTFMRLERLNVTFKRNDRRKNDARWAEEE